MAQIWIQFTEDDGSEGSARWGDITEEQIDRILAAATTWLGAPNTTT